MFKRKTDNRAPDVLIFGLGNPGSKYSGTRHNAGWWALDALTLKHQVTRRESKHQSQAEFITLEAVDELLNVALIRPTTFMNLSGESLRGWRSSYREARLVVVYDDIALPVGKLRIREKGSAGGHNGVKSVLAALPGQDFWRLKIGVGAPPEGQDSADYVLEPPTQAEREAIFRSLPVASSVLEELARGDSEAAQKLIAKYEQSLRPPKEEKPNAEKESAPAGNPGSETKELEPPG